MQVVGIVADVLSFVPGVDAVAIPVAIAVGAAEGGQDLADGNILGGCCRLPGRRRGAWASMPRRCQRRSILLKSAEVKLATFAGQDVGWA